MQRPYDHPPRLPEGERVDLPAFLGGDGPVELEIGPGRGAFLLERCRAAPEARLLGMEIRRKWATIVDERLAAAGCAHRARVVCEDARHALPRLAPDGCVARAFLHFPDPWWKKRHQKRLVLGDALLVELARLLTVGGELFVQTDVPARAEQYIERVAACSTFAPAGRGGSPALDENPYEARSNRERRCEKDGLPILRLCWRRIPAG